MTLDGTGSSLMGDWICVEEDVGLGIGTEFEACFGGLTFAFCGGLDGSVGI